MWVRLYITSKQNYIYIQNFELNEINESNKFVYTFNQVNLISFKLLIFTFFFINLYMLKIIR